MHLKPSDIYFSQDSINNVFDKRCAHSYEPIGDTLDALCTGRCRISDIPTITVVEKDGKWVTADNRRLWVFREMERLGKCDTIPVYKGNYIPSAKMTSYNGGESVHVRGSPGGTWHNKPSARKPSASQSNTRSKATSSTNNLSTSMYQRNTFDGYTSTSRGISPDNDVSTYNTLAFPNNRVSPVNIRSTVKATNYKTFRPWSATSSSSQYNIRQNIVQAPRTTVASYTASPRVGPGYTATPRVGPSYTATPRVGPSYIATPRVGPSYSKTPTSYTSSDARSNGSYRQEIKTFSPSPRQDSNTTIHIPAKSILKSSGTTSSQRHKPEDRGCCIIL